MAAITIVDDDDAVQDSLRAILESYGFEVSTYSSGTDFLQRQDSSTVDCLILDINLPQMSGWEVLEKLAAGTASVPVILISGVVNDSTRRRATQSEAHCLIEKPLAAQALLSAIDSVLSQRAPCGGCA